MDETLMIEPPSPAAIRAPTRTASRKGPLKLTSTTLSKRASDTSIIDGARGESPALLIRTSTRPNAP